MNQSNNQTSNNKNKKVTLKHFAIFGAIAFALMATIIPSYSIGTAFEQNAGSGGDGGNGGFGGHANSGFNEAEGGDGGTGGNGGESTGGEGGDNNNGIIVDDYEIVAPFDAALEEFGIDVDTDVGTGGDSDGGDGGAGGDGGLAGIESGDATGGDAGDGGDAGKGGDAIAICNTLGCI